MEQLEYKNKHISNILNEKENKDVYDFGDEYKKFLDNKTERECVKSIIDVARKNGFINIDEVNKLKPNDKIYIVNKNKNVLLCVVGNEDICRGINLIASHIDSPRLDLKQKPLYEDVDLALFKTHYYGGIKKYQWTTIPLAMHGVIYDKNNEKKEICIGENNEDEVFCITDLLPHLSKEQMDKKLKDGIDGENLNILVGGSSIDDSNVKKKILNVLYEKYGITEKSFISAEIEFVPAFKARDVGFDKILIGGYGQDDRSCSYASLKSILDIDKPSKTCISLFVDKEEIGSNGNTGMTSNFFYSALIDIISKCNGVCNLSDINTTLKLSRCISADVTNGYDPNYKSVDDEKNVNRLGYGVAISKFTGSRGKSGTSDANAEYLNEIIKLFDENNVVWQTGELGKIDIGGGGTIAMFITNYNIDVIDVGIPMLSMHSPFEIISKYDIYMLYKAYYSFYNKM